LQQSREDKCKKHEKFHATFRFNRDQRKKILENYSKNPISSSKLDLENAYRANCCDAPNNRGIGGLLRRQKRAGPICRWIKRVKEEIQ